MCWCERSERDHPDKMSHYEKFFDEADVDGSGFLSFDELIGALKKGGYSGDDDKIRVNHPQPMFFMPPQRNIIVFLSRPFVRPACVFKFVNTTFTLIFKFKKKQEIL